MIYRNIYWVIQMPKIPFYYIWSAFTVPGSQLPDLWNFLNVENDKGVFYYVNEATLEAPKKGGWLPGELGRIRGWGGERTSGLNKSSSARDLVNHDQIWSYHADSAWVLCGFVAQSSPTLLLSFRL